MSDQLLKIFNLQWAEPWMIEALFTVLSAVLIGYIAFKTARLISENSQ